MVEKPDSDTIEPATADIEFTEREIDLLTETLPKIIVEERQLDARNALLKTGRDRVLESVQEKLEDATPERSVMGDELGIEAALESIDADAEEIVEELESEN